MAPQAAPESQSGDFQTQDVSEFYVTVGVTMQDGGPIPYGLTWSLQGGGTTIDSGPVTGGVTSFSTTATVAVPNGNYGLWVTGGGYSSGQSIIVEGADTGHTFNFARAMVSASFPITTSSGDDVPAGTVWSITDAGSNEVAGGSLPVALPSGTVWGPETLERGVYTLSINAPGFAPFSAPVDLTNVWATEFSVDVALQQETSTISFDVSMKDGGPLPNGLVWNIYPSGEWNSLASGDIPAGTTTFSDQVELPYGVYQFWVTGNGYSSGQVLNANTPETPHVVTLDRLTATADVTLTTADGRDIPAGTTFTLKDSQDTPQITFTSTTDETSPYVFDNQTELEFDAYTLTVNAPGFYPLVVDMPITNGWVTEYHFSGELKPILSTVSFTVSMSDGGPLPYGLQWALDPGYSGEVPQGDDLFSYTIDEQVELGVYQLWVTGNGYSSGQALNITGAETHHDVVLDRLNGTLTVTLTTSDEGVIPAGTTWELLDAGSNVVQSGVLADPIPNGGTLPLENPIEFGIYTLNMGPGGPDGMVPMALAAAPREILPFSTTINITDPWSTEYNATADLQIAPTESTVTFSVSMSDDGPLPNGLQVSLIPDGTWDPYATTSVTAGETTFDGTFDEVPFGIYSIWVTGNGYSSGQVLDIQNAETHHDFRLDRLIGTLDLSTVTTDDRDIPAGTTFTITDSADATVWTQTTTDTMTSGETVATIDEIEFDTYTLTVEAPGFYPFTMALPITNPWIQDYSFTAELEPILSSVSFTVSMSDDGPLPNGLTVSLFPSGTWDAFATVDVPAGETDFAGEIGEPVELGVYQLWVTGNGYSSGQVLNITGPETHHDFVLDRLSGSVTITLDTSDEAEVPAGTTWSITDSAGTIIQEGTLDTAIADGGTLPVANPFEFDVYTLTINADGYHPFSMEMPVTNPWTQEFAFIASLVSDKEPVPTETPTETPTQVPTGTPGTPTPTQTRTPGTSTPEKTATATPATVTELPKTGQGSEEGVQYGTILLAAASLLVLAGAAGLRLRDAHRA